MALSRFSSVQPSYRNLAEGASRYIPDRVNSLLSSVRDITSQSEPAPAAPVRSQREIDEEERLRKRQKLAEDIRSRGGFDKLDDETAVATVKYAETLGVTPDQFERFTSREATRERGESDRLAQRQSLASDIRYYLAPDRVDPNSDPESYSATLAQLREKAAEIGVDDGQLARFMEREGIVPPGSVDRSLAQQHDASGFGGLSAHAQLQAQKNEGQQPGANSSMSKGVKIADPMTAALRKAKSLERAGYAGAARALEELAANHATEEQMLEQARKEAAESGDPALFEIELDSIEDVKRFYIEREKRAAAAAEQSEAER